MGRIVGLTHIFKKSCQLVISTKMYGVTITLKETVGNRIIFNNSVRYGDIFQGQKKKRSSKLVGS